MDAQGSPKARCVTVGASVTTLFVVLGVGPRPRELLNPQHSQGMGCPLTVLCRVPGTGLPTGSRVGPPFTLTHTTVTEKGWSGLHGAGWETETSIGGMNADSSREVTIKKMEVNHLELHTGSGNASRFLSLS